jgi:uncharacterized membrane-anchored protein
MRKVIALLAGLAVLAIVNFSIHQREKLLTEGKVVLLELAPVDPRSLMQGDYMALNFAVARVLRDQRGQEKVAENGRIVLRLDPRGVGSFARIDQGTQGTPLAPNEVVLRYRIRDRQPRFGTNAFFFQEGEAERYASAKYGEFRVAADGEAILTGLRGADLKKL